MHRRGLPIADRAGTRLGSTGSTTPTRSRRGRARCFPARPRRAPRSRPPSSRYVPRAIVARLRASKREVFLFSALFADCASARCRVRLSLENVENGFRNAIVGRVGARPRALDRGRRSIALGRPRARRPDRPESRLPASRARAPPPPPPRDADRGGVFRRDSTPRGNNTHLRFDEIARSRERKKKKQPLTISRLPAARSSPHAAPTATARLDSSRFSRRFTSPRLGATTAGGTS